MMTGMEVAGVPVVTSRYLQPGQGLVFDPTTGQAAIVVHPLDAIAIGHSGDALGRLRASSAWFREEIERRFDRLVVSIWMAD